MAYSAKVIMICTPDVTLMCLALYSNSTTGMYFSHRQDIHSDGTLMDTEWIGNGVITNSNLHAGARVLAAGAAPQPLKQ